MIVQPQKPSPEPSHAMVITGTVGTSFLISLAPDEDSMNQILHEERSVNLSRKRSTRPTPGPTSLWKTSLFGADGCGRVGASFFAFSTLPPISINSSRGTWTRNSGNCSFSSSLT